MHSNEQVLPIAIGTTVRVSDGTPEPPKRFNRKHQDWENRNYDGVVVAHNPPCRYRARPSYDIQTGNLFSAVILITRSGVAPESVSPVPGAPHYVVGGDQCSQHVSGIAA